MKNIILSTLVITTSVLVVNVAQADTPFPWGMHKVKFRISKISEG